MARLFSTYRAARRNAAKSDKAWKLKLFRLWASGWWTEVNAATCDIDLSIPRQHIDRWRRQDPLSYRAAWNDFLAA